MASSLSTTRFLISQRMKMAKNKGKKRKLAERDEDQNSDAIDEKLLLSIDKFLEIQGELDKINEEASIKVLEVEQKYNEICVPIYNKRNDIAKSIPSFWSTAFLNHPALDGLLSNKDRKIFKHLTCLEVEDFRDVKSGYLMISFNFFPNLYFEDTKITKTYAFHDEGTKISTTIIKWKEEIGMPSGVSCEMEGNKRPPTEESFFSWFADTQQKSDMDESHDRVADIIKDLWQDPLTYFINESSTI
ncbi:NAP1-related protein 1-like [Humulus lupulus]|uniref:NAP1-related protein 1-like n=1 Tax=Humulus lupulus TaxID=3486 RepID=UPI002B404D61|nr:NAP1-related protein 1-like [Humulus lupulus]